MAAKENWLIVPGTRVTKYSFLPQNVKQMVRIAKKRYESDPFEARRMPFWEFLYFIENKYLSNLVKYLGCLHKYEKL
jgi:hypothetical protein